MFSPSAMISPPSGWMFPIISRSSVDFPEPDPPMTTSVSPSKTSRRIESSTVCAPNRLVTSMTWMAVSGMRLQAEVVEHAGEHQVDGDQGDDRVDDGFRGGIADAFGAAGDVEAEEARQAADQGAEDAGLHQAGQEILEFDDVEDALDVLAVGDAEEGLGDEHAAGGADQIGD